MDNSIMKSINTLLKETDLADRSSFYQFQCFILGKEPTMQGKLHQCLLELKTRQNSLEAIELELEEQQDRMILLDIEVKRKLKYQDIDEFAESEKEIILRQLDRQKKAILIHLDKLQRNKKTLEEEALFWINAFEQLSKKESLKQWDDPDVQKEYWSEKLRQEVNLRLLLRQLPDAETMRSILSLHDDSVLKKRIIEMLQNENKKQLKE